MLIKNRLNYIRFEKVYKPLNGFSSIRIVGIDSCDFLNRQLTSNVLELRDNEFQHSSILDIKGRLVSSFYLLKMSPDEYFVIVQEDNEKVCLERFNLYLISEDVELELVEKHFYSIFGIIPESLEGFRGRMFNENCLLVETKPTELEELIEVDYELLKFSSGEPQLGKEVKEGELFVNSYLTKTSLSMHKGCYPGQETVSKILNNRGAAKFPVCLVSKTKFKKNEIYVNSKKIGEILNYVHVDDEHYYYALINREYRVDQMSFVSDSIKFTVHYFPLFKNSIKAKAQDLFYDAVDDFQQDHIEAAIEKLQLTIQLDPSFEDAYESLGVIYGRIDENYKAIDLMNKLTKLNEKSVMAHTNLSLYYMKIGEIALAEEHKATATVKQFEVFGNEAQAKREKKQKLLQDQEEQLRKEGMFKQVLEIDPEDALANLGMGEIEFNNLNFFSSEKFLNQSITTDPQYSVAYLALSKTLLASDQKDKLKEVLLEGIKVATKSGDLMPANEMQKILNDNF